MVRKRILGGALLIAGAAVSIVFGAQALLNAIDNIDSEFGGLAVVSMYLASFIIVLNTVAVVGGALALAGRAWVVAMVGAVLGTLGGFYPGVGSVLGLIAIILLALSRDEFHGERGMPVPQPYPPGFSPPGYPPQPWYQPPPYPPHPNGQHPYPQTPPPQMPPPQQPPAQP